MTGSLQGFLEEPLGRSCVTLSGKPKVDRGAGGIYGTIQVPPVPTLADVGFVDPPGAVGWFQFPPASLVQFGCVALHPAPNGSVVSLQTPFYAAVWASASSLSDSCAQFLQHIHMMWYVRHYLDGRSKITPKAHVEP